MNWKEKVGRVIGRGGGEGRTDGWLRLAADARQPAQAPPALPWSRRGTAPCTMSVGSEEVARRVNEAEGVQQQSRNEQGEDETRRRLRSKSLPQ
eukprot:60297-Hanusia_phi.AAC.2